MLTEHIPVNILAMYRKYERWVSSNPQLVGDIETSVKWLSYILVGMLLNAMARNGLNDLKNTFFDS